MKSHEMIPQFVEFRNQLEVFGSKENAQKFMNAKLAEILTE
jgi:hypothetical protein